VARLTSKRSAGSQRQLPDRKNGKVVEMLIGNDPVDPTKILTLCERRKTKNNALRGRDRTLFKVSARPSCDPYVAARGWNKNSCTVLHVRSIK
jgi:hypothetical protein